MIIHVVQEGDTIAALADQYNISVTRLVHDNGLENIQQLILGQTIVISQPERTYTVQEGDTLQKIADINGIPLIQLIRNNPYLCQRDYIYPGEILVISYDNSQGKISTNCFANSFININRFGIILPLLSYISVFGYKTVDSANILEIDDEDIIRLAKEYKVTPIMVLATSTNKGRESYEAIFHILYNKELIDKHIENILSILHRKGYQGLNISYQYINEKNRQVYEDYTEKLAARLKQEGFLVFITFSEHFIKNEDRITFEKTNLMKIGKLVDGITLLNYSWGYSFDPPGPVISAYMIIEYLNYMIQHIPPEKIEVGIPIIGYDWELPYIIGVTRANSLTLDSALALASDVGATIQFDEVSKTPYFNYVIYKDGIPRNHVVWFIDSRTIDAILNIIKDYGLRGPGIWTIMNCYPQIRQVMNSQYNIETLDS